MTLKSYFEFFFKYFESDEEKIVFCMSFLKINQRNFNSIIKNYICNSINVRTVPR